MFCEVALCISLYHVLSYIVLHLANKHIDSIAENCSNSTANAVDLLQSCTKPSNTHFNGSASLHMHIYNQMFP